MRNLNSKKLSILVALVMMISMVAGMSVTAQAEVTNSSIAIDINGTSISQAQMSENTSDISTETYIRYKKNVPQTYEVTGIKMSTVLSKFTSNPNPDSITISSPDNKHNPGTPYVVTINRPTDGWSTAMITWVRINAAGEDEINNTLDFAVNGSPAKQWVKNITIMTTN